MISTADDRIVGIGKYRATGGILANNSSLRTAQNLNVGHIVIGLFLEIAGKARDTVTIGDHPCGGQAVGFCLADAADVEFQTLSEIVDYHARHRELQCIGRENAFFGEVLAGQHSRRDRCLQKVFAAALGSDDNFVRRLVLGIFRSINVRRGLWSLLRRSCSSETKAKRRHARHKYECSHELSLPLHHCGRTLQGGCLMHRSPTAASRPCLSSAPQAVQMRLGDNYLCLRFIAISISVNIWKSLFYDTVCPCGRQINRRTPHGNPS